MNKCQFCGSDMKVVPAGVSKATGKPYNAFEACTKGCKKPSYQQPSYRPETTYQKEQKEVDWDKISMGKCKTLFLVEAFKKGLTLAEAEPMSEEWAKACMRFGVVDTMISNFVRTEKELDINEIPF